MFNLIRSDNIYIILFKDDNMTRWSNNLGRAFEYITLITLNEEISKVREVVIKMDNSYIATKNAWEKIGEQNQLNLKIGAKSAIESIFNLEPMILEDDGGKLELLIQSDSNGEEGDVRDILLVRRDVQWEVGLSLKHNNFAVKHSRIAKDLDFGDKWYGVSCSNQYWEEIAPIFNYLEDEKSRGSMWSDLPDKMDDVYIPLLKAFKGEVLRCYNSNPNIAKDMAKYLLGKYDYYKVISEDENNRTQILTFNSSGTLNKASSKNQPTTSIPIVELPTEIITIDFKPRSKTTIIMSMDGGWEFSFRIHNADKNVEASLKFDINLIKKPETINSFICEWDSF